MEQKTIIAAVEKHMDVVEDIFKWVILLTIPVLWTGLQRKDELEALGMKFKLTQAFYILAVLYLFVTLSVYLMFRRIGDYLILLNRENISEGISTILVHNWPLNPFSYSGEKIVTRLHNCYGYAGLIATWWICNTALYTLLGFRAGVAAIIFLGLFLMAGLGAMFAINRVLSLIVEKLKEVDAQLSEQYKSTIIERQFGAFIGIVIGIAIFGAAQIILGLFSFKAFPNPTSWP